MTTGIKNFQSMKEAKDFSLSKDILGLMIKGRPNFSKVTFETARCSSLEDHKKEAEQLKQGNCVFVLTRKDKIKYFVLSQKKNEIVSVSFGKPLFQDWKEFYLETLAQVFGPEA